MARRGGVSFSTGGVRTGRRVPRPDPVSDRSWRGLPLRAAHRVLYHHYDAQRAYECNSRSDAADPVAGDVRLLAHQHRPDPHDLLVPFPSELMKIWPIGTRVNKPQNDDLDILDPIDDTEPHLATPGCELGDVSTLRAAPSLSTGLPTRARLVERPGIGFQSETFRSRSKAAIEPISDCEHARCRRFRGANNVRCLS